MTIPTWITPSGFLFTATELVFTSTNLVASGTNVTYKILSGILPSGLTLSNTGTISGTPNTVLTTSTNIFVVRAKTTSSIADRTFFIDTIGPDDPVWVTQSGYLPIGINGVYYVLNNEYVDFQLNANFPETPIGSPVQYYIQNKDGKLPPGLKLSFDGKITGIVSDTLEFDGDISATGGYDSEFYDGYTYDHASNHIGIQGIDTPVGTPKIYQFRVTVSNSITSIVREFKIVVTTNRMLKYGFNSAGSITVTQAASTGTNTAVVNTISSIVLGQYAKINNVLNKVTQITTATNLLKFANTFTQSINTGTILTLYSSNMPQINGNWSYMPNQLSSIQTLQWIENSNLGDIRADNFHSIKVSVYDPSPLDGPVFYSLVTGTTVFENIPMGLELDQLTGRIFGYLPYQPAYKINYEFDIQATKVNVFTQEIFTTTNTFTLAVKGEIERTIAWVTDNNLGSIYEGLISELAVKAVQLQTTYPIKYTLMNGQLPSGLELQTDGSIAGRVGYNTTGTYTFTILASDIYELSAIEKTFNLTVNRYNNKLYTDIYVRPFLPLTKRQMYRDFISNEFTFDPTFLYRPFDPKFGIQTDLKMYLQFGIERVNLSEYAFALQENFYRKRLFFGELKLAIARDSDKNIIYEVIYVDIIDDLENAPRLFYDKNNIFYPASIQNMRNKLSKLVLPNYSYVDVDEYNRPRFMQTAQEGDYKPVGYIPVVPICYALPGQGSKILSRIAISKFNFNIFDFEIDRIIVENPLDAGSAKYLIMERQSIGDNIPSDNIIYGLDEITINVGTDKPLSRE